MADASGKQRSISTSNSSDMHYYLQVDGLLRVSSEEFKALTEKFREISISFFETKSSKIAVGKLLVYLQVSSMTETTAWPYLDKLYAALIRCLVYCGPLLNKSWFSCFKRLYLLAGGSDVTRRISCDRFLHLFGFSLILR